MNISRFDQPIAEYIRTRAGSAPRTWSFFARFAMYLYVVEAILFAFVMPREPWLVLALSAIGCYVATVLVQMIIRRQRPHALPQGFKLWIHTYSFPSAHASESFACSVLASAAAVAFVPVLAPVIIALNFCLAVVIALSRVVVGVHYPSDVIAGALFGSLLGLGLVLLT